MMFRTEPGWIGLFWRNEAPGAYRNGTRIEKVHSEPGDANRDGTTGVVLGSISAPGVGIGYFVEWSSDPYKAVFVVDHRVKPTMPGFNRGH